MSNSHYAYEIRNAKGQPVHPWTAPYLSKSEAETIAKDNNGSGLKYGLHVRRIRCDGTRAEAEAGEVQGVLNILGAVVTTEPGNPVYLTVERSGKETVVTVNGYGKTNNVPHVCIGRNGAFAYANGSLRKGTPVECAEAIVKLIKAGKIKKAV